MSATGNYATINHIVIDTALGGANPNSTFEELEALGLSRCDPNILVQLLGEAVKGNKLDRAEIIQNALWKHSIGVQVKHKKKDRGNIPLMPWHRMPGSQLDGRNYLFISGVPRSGTTAMGRLIGKHRDIGMYRELYGEDGAYLPEMFNPLNIKLLSDRGVLDLKKHNQMALEKSKTSKWIGDKRPNFMRWAEVTFKNFKMQNIKVIHIMRSIYDIAWSYEQKRAGTSPWRSRWGHRKSVHHANMNNRNVLRLLGGVHGENILLVDYDSFFTSSANAFTLIERLGLDRDGLDPEEFGVIIREAAKIRDVARELPPDQKKYIDSHYDMYAEQELRKRGIFVQ